MKTVFFDSKTHLTHFANMRLKTALIPIVGKAHGKYSFVSHTKAQSRILTDLLHSCEITCNVWVLECKAQGQDDVFAHTTINWEVQSCSTVK